MYGLGKQRSKLGKWLDSRGIKQEWLMQKSGVSKGTVVKICNEDDYIPNGVTMKKITQALRSIDGSVKAEQFWDI